MTTWLDQYSYRTRANRLLVQPELAKLDVRETMALYTREQVIRCDDANLTESERVLLQFEADLHGFFSDAFKLVRSAATVSHCLGKRLSSREPSRDAIRLFGEHVSRSDFSFIHLPSGAFEVGKDVEAKAVFVRIAKVAGPEPHNEPLGGAAVLFDLVVGRRDTFTRQRLSWRAGKPDLWPCDEHPEDDLFPRTPPVMDLIAAAGGDPAEVVQRAQWIAIAAMAHARAYSGTALARPVPKVQNGHPTLFRDRPARKRTILDLIELRSAEESAESGRWRDPLH